MRDSCAPLVRDGKWRHQICRQRALCSRQIEDVDVERRQCSAQDTRPRRIREEDGWLYHACSWKQIVTKLRHSLCRPHHLAREVLESSGRALW
jgi:hypothetical protein